MVREKPASKAAWVLLFLSLLLGGGGSEVWAGDNSGTQVVLVLDFSGAAEGDRVPHFMSQGAGLLVHLLKDQDSLGLVVSGGQGRVILPPARLTPEHRAQSLDTLARLTAAPRQESLTAAVQQALNLFHSKGVKRRVLFFLTDGAGEIDRPKDNANTAEIQHIAAQAQAAGVAVFVASLSPSAQTPKIKDLTAATGGRFWEVKEASDLHVACLKLFQHLEQTQEVPITGNRLLLDRWVRQLVLVAARSVPGKGVILTSPKGARVTPATRAKTIRWVACQAYDLITVSAPRSGVWSLANARPADSRAFVASELTLSAAGTPREVGEDEALRVIAALSGDKETLAGSGLLTGTQFHAELTISDSTPLTTALKPQERGLSPDLPPDAQVGRFPPPHHQGEGTLRILALGKAFQRLVSLPIAITQPWYRPAPATSDAQGGQLRFQPGSGRRPEQVGGTITVKSAQGALAGAFINPAPGAEVLIIQPPGCQHLCLADLHLRGTAPGGRSLEIGSELRPLETSQKIYEKTTELGPQPTSEEKIQRSSPPNLNQKIRRRWFGLALSGMGVTVFLASLFLFFRLRSEPDDAEGEDGSGGSSRKNILRLKAQVEVLAKEKAQLQAALEEKKGQLDRLQAEKAEVEASLQRVKAKSQTNLNSLEELEKKLEEAESEAQAVRQEYMALYARNQKEKETLQKS